MSGHSRFLIQYDSTGWEVAVELCRMVLSTGTLRKPEARRRRYLTIPVPLRPLSFARPVPRAFPCGHPVWSRMVPCGLSWFRVVRIVCLPVLA